MVLFASQCLNAVRQASSLLRTKAAFSTSSRAAAGSGVSAQDDLLRALGGITGSPGAESSPYQRRTQPPNLPTRANRFPNAAAGSKRSTPNRVLSEMVRGEQRRSQNRSPNKPPEVQENEERKAMTRQITRRWRAGDVYAPHDLSPAEMRKWKARKQPERDVFDMLALDPLVEYKNFSIMSEYMTPMGRIKHGRETGLRKVNQRKIAKAIRRSIGIGMMPSVHRHPEILRQGINRSNLN